MRKGFVASRPSRWSKGVSGTNREALTSLMRRSTEQLCTTLSIGATYVGPFAIEETRWQRPLSMLPFTGVELAGSLLLAAPFELMGETTPSGEQDHEALADWSRELANLLAGTLKTALLRQGVIIELGIPASLLGSEVRIALPAATSLGLLFVAGTNPLHIGLAAYLADDVTLRVDEGSGAPFDVLLF
ncbi:MAG: hypothetical protein HOV80_31625 [Polyangiaceae bacterium]|nr:hypothetical protein [Polyangiaceae bacterium]